MNHDCGKPTDSATRCTDCIAANDRKYAALAAISRKRVELCDAIVVASMAHYFEHGLMADTSVNRACADLASFEKEQS